MEKIVTVFERGLDRKVAPGASLVLALRELVGADVTEKVDGMNVRLTVRSGTLVRVEARRNPTKPQKQDGIAESWYRDAYVYGGDTPKNADSYLVEAAENTDLSTVPNGEWSGEAIGPRIQGNPLGLENREVVLFSVPAVRHARLTFDPAHAPGGFDHAGTLRDWMRNTESLVSPGHPIEGIVFWQSDGDGNSYPVGKLKLKDFA